MEQTYRIKEVVGTQEFYIQKRFLTRKKIDNPKLWDRLIFFIFSIENEDEYSWQDLTVMGNFSGIYYSKIFKNIQEATSVFEKMKSAGEIKIHQLN